MLSHSEISTYLDCQRKWKLAYKDGIKCTNQHFQFGEMAHRMLESGEIPDEMLYPELKEYFKIPSWKLYFETIQDNVTKTVGTDRILYRELRLEDDELDLVGVIDLVTYNDKSDKYTLFDYKFTSTPRSTTALKLDEQLILYALLFSRKEKIPIDKIDIGYINIPKKGIDYPAILKNGSLSKASAQSTTYELYLEKIRELDLNIEDYQDRLDVLKTDTFVKTVRSDVSIDSLKTILMTIDNVKKDMNKGYILEKNTFMCEKCEYLKYCKGVNIE